MKRLTTILFILLCQLSYSQDDTNEFALRVKSIDTLSSDRSYYSVVIDMFDTVVEVQRWKPFKIDSLHYIEAKRLAEAAKIEYIAPDSTWAEFHNSSSQNCYVNSQVHMMKNNAIDAQLVFGKNTTMGMTDFKVLLSRMYKLSYRIPTKPKKNLKSVFPDNTLIVMRNKSDWPTHAMYHDRGVFYSKYGAGAYKEETSLKEVFKRYWDTQFIEVYKLDWDRLRPYLDKI